MKVFVTGISSKLGVALAQELLHQGHEVWGIARTSDFLKEFSNKQNHIDRFSFSLCDTTEQADIVRVGEEMTRARFLPDAAVLGAGILEHDMIPEFSYESFLRMHAANCSGALLWVSWFLPHFKKLGGGVFVAIASTQVFHPSDTNAGYAASKAALAVAFRNLRARYKKEKIFFTSVYFGPVTTWRSPMKEKFFVQEPSNVVPCIIKALSGKRSAYYKPFFLKPLLVLSLFLPECFVVALLKFLRRE